MSSSSRVILIVLDGLWVGGTERSMAELLPYLQRGGFEPVVACFRQRREGVEDWVRGLGIEIRFLETNHLLPQVLKLRRLYEELQPAIVHAALFRANLVSRLAAVQAPVFLLNSLVNTPYTPVRHLDPHLRSSRLALVRRIDALTARRVDHFHAVSQAAKDAAVRDLALPQERISIVVRGRDPERLGAPSEVRRRAVRQRLGMAQDSILLTNVGRQDFQKNQGILLRALAELAPAHRRTHLLLVGREGSMTPQLARLRIQLGLEDRVHFLGHREDVPDILAATDVFVFPSLFEGFPGAVVEAMGLGLPVIASDIPPHRDLVRPKETGLLIEPHSVESLARGIDCLLRRRDEAHQMGLAARRIFLDRLTLDKVADQMLRLYTALAR